MKSKKYKPEQLINQRPITQRALLRYNKKVNATCKILTSNKSSGTGFFCEIKINNKLMKVLFTNYHVLNNIKKNIKIEYNNEIKYININNRFICQNEELDYICIEIYNNDNIENYFKIDKNINCINPYKEYRYDEFAMIEYPGGNGVAYANGYINKIINEQIYHSINSEQGSSGSPLLLDTRSLKVIGIHCGSAKDLNRGIFIKYILYDIKKQISNQSNSY